MEVLLRPNRRAIYAGLALPAVIALAGLALAVAPWDAAKWWRGVGLGLAAFGLLLVGLLLWQLRQPRLAYASRHLLIFLRSGPPLRLPVELVQCAFLGTGPTQMSGPAGAKLRSSNLVIRLEEKATEWHEREVKPALGRWSDGYITIHGAWCEPLTLEVVQRLNTRLHELNQPAATPLDSKDC